MLATSNAAGICPAMQYEFEKKSENTITSFIEPSS